MTSATRTSSDSSIGVPAATRRLAGRLAEAFGQDQALAERQNACQHRLQAANGDLWSGLHPDALGLIYDDTHAVAIDTPATVGSRITAVIADARFQQQRYAAAAAASTEVITRREGAMGRLAVSVPASADGAAGQGDGQPPALGRPGA